MRYSQANFGNLGIEMNGAVLRTAWVFGTDTP
jgi:hypothetical protein